jgi:ribosomal protein S18 acetylase RimI-like enzyme
MKFLHIDNTNLFYLKDFIKNMGDSSKTFRYFLNRRPEDVIPHHVITFLLYDSGQSVGYGHLDKEGDKVWLGVCIKEEKRAQGYGKEIMKKLIDSYEGEIYLSVDKINKSAISLYKKFLFKELENNDNIIYMKRDIDDSCL